MAKSTHRLNAIKAANVKAAGMHPDGAGLYLKVDKGGSKSWVFRYMCDRRQRYLGLGSVTSALDIIHMVLHGRSDLPSAASTNWRQLTPCPSAQRTDLRSQLRK